MILEGLHSDTSCWPVQTAAVGEAILRDLPGGLAATPRAATDVEFSKVELCGYGPFRWGSNIARPQY